MTPPKVRFLRPNKVFWAPRSFLGPPKTQKIDFLKKPELCDLTEHWRWFPQWPWLAGYLQTPVYNSKINYLAVAQCVELAKWIQNLSYRIARMCSVWSIVQIVRLPTLGGNFF